MSDSLRFYQDAGMTVPLPSLSAVQADDGNAAGARGCKGRRLELAPGFGKVQRMAGT